MKAVDLKFALFSVGMGTAISSSLVFIYILIISLMGKQSMVYERNPIIAIGEILLLIFTVGTCIVSAEIYQKYQKTSPVEGKT